MRQSVEGPSDDTSRRRAQRILACLYWATVTLLLAGGIAGIIAAKISTEHFGSWLQQTSPHHDARLSQGQIERLKIKSGIVGIIGLIGAAGLVWLRRPLAKAAVPGIDQLSASFRELKESFRADFITLSRSALALLATITAGAFAARLYFINQPIRIDEASTAMSFASKPLVIGLSNYAAPNNHLLHTFLAHFSLMLLGNSPWALRVPALLAGVLLVPMTFWVGRRLYNASTGLIAAAMVGGSSFLIEYSTNARGYTIQASLFLACVLLMDELRRKPSPAARVGLAVCLALGFYAIPTMLFALFGLLAWATVSLLFGEINYSSKHYIVSLLAALVTVGVLTALLYAPVLVVCGPSALIDNAYVVPLSLDAFLHGLPGMVWRCFCEMTQDLPAVSRIVLGSAIVLGIARHARKSGSRDRMSILFPVLIGAILVLLLQRVLPFDRVWIYVLPLAYITAAAGISLCISTAVKSKGWRTGLTSGVAVALLIVASTRTMMLKTILTDDQTGTVTEGPEVAAFVMDHMGPNDRIVMASQYLVPITYYLWRSGYGLDRVYTEGSPLRGRGLLVTLRPAAALEASMSLLKIANPHLTQPKLIYKTGNAEIYELQSLDAGS